MPSSPPYEAPDGRIEIDPQSCTLADCCLKQQFAADGAATAKLEQACAALSEKPEMAKRRAVLRDIRRKPRAELSHSQCLALGDAVFALQCPIDAVVLTTNLVDHKPLTEAVGKIAVTPADQASGLSIP